MYFSEYVQQQMKRRKLTYSKPILEEILIKSKVSMLTLRGLMKGQKLVRYDKAKAVSDATQGKVSVEELCAQS
jgi:hypothetical protein